jgi:dihydropteroate synthase
MLSWQLRDRTLDLDGRCLVMGIVNVTPDSFSDGGRYAATEAAIAHGLELVQQGADLLDIGGESTRPGSEPVSLEEELRRVVPVVSELARQVAVPLSIDTSKAPVARACLAAGSHVINDVTGLRGDPDMTAVARAQGAGVIVMHMQGTPATMQQAPQYDDVVIDLFQFFQERVKSVRDQGLPEQQIALDPGVGFGKNLQHNLRLLARLDTFASLGRPICLGVSRKGLFGAVLGRPAEQRLAGALAVSAFALAQGAVQILRVHDVAATHDVVKMWEVLAKERNGSFPFSPGS